jgi:hypothetical protein
LDKELQEGLVRQTIEVDKNIDELNRNITTATGFFSQTGYRLRYRMDSATVISVPHSGFVDEYY